MFADSLLESSWIHHSRRRWVTLISFGMQALAISGLLLLPLLYTERLPQLHFAVRDLLVPPHAPAPPAPSAHRHPANASVSNLQGHTLLAPGQIPNVVRQFNETQLPPPDLPAGFAVLGRRGPGGPGSIFGSGGNEISLVAPPPMVSHTLRFSHMDEGSLIHRVQPVYPPLARQAGVQGVVVLQARISRLGTIENLQMVSGHPLLVKAAMDAVRQWRYRPYVLNGEAVEIETQVTVNFTLSGR
jgi:protein TonB